MSNIPIPDKKIELRIAINTCEVIYGELKVKDHVFYENALKLMPNVIAYANLYY